MRRRTRLAATLGVVVLVGIEVALVSVLPTQPAFAFAVAACALALAFVLSAPYLPLVAVFPATYAYWRVGGAGADVSVADLLTVVAVLAALPFVPWRNQALRRILTALACYAGLLGLGVLVTPSGRAFAELGHRMLLFGGAIVIGAAIAHRGEVTAALRAFIAASAVVALAAIVDAVTSDFDPSFPFGMHKNYAGPLFGVAALLLFLVPERFVLSKQVVTALRVLMLVGLFATRSRGAGLAFVAVLALYAIRRSEGRQRQMSAVVLVAAVALLAVSVATLRNEEEGPNSQFNGVNTREDDYDFAFNQVWAPHPITGGGLKWFRSGGSFSSGPHNIVVAELSESGVVGLAGLIALVGVTFGALWKRRDSLARVATLVFVFEILFGMTGIFWLAGTLTLPMLVVGLAIGEGQPDDSRQAPIRPPLVTER